MLFGQFGHTDDECEVHVDAHGIYSPLGNYSRSRSTFLDTYNFVQTLVCDDFRYADQESEVCLDAHAIFRHKTVMTALDAYLLASS